MLRIEVREERGDPLPAIDVAGDGLVIGSGPDAQIRLPARAARAIHVRVDGDRWIAIADLGVRDGRDATVVGSPAARDRAPAGARACRAGETGTVGDGVTFEIGGYQVRVAPAPAGAVATPPQRTESLARELVRGLMGAGAAPTIEVERGPGRGAKRPLPPPEATVVIGRGDEATWVILDEDLSRRHAELCRGWDGVTIRDLGSKNGTRVDGVVIAGTTPLRDGARLELGNVVLRFRDPAERFHEPPSAPPPRAAAPPPVAPARPPAPWPFVVATAIAGLAVAGLVWILAT